MSTILLCNLANAYYSSHTHTHMKLVKHVNYFALFEYIIHKFETNAWLRPNSFKNLVKAVKCAYSIELCILWSHARHFCHPMPRIGTYEMWFRIVTQWTDVKNLNVRGTHVYKWLFRAMDRLCHVFHVQFKQKIFSQ